MSTAEKTYGSEFRRIRRECGMTLEDVANILGVSIPYVSDVERRQRAPFTGPQTAKVMTAWNRGRDIDDLMMLAAEHRGEVQLQPKGADQRAVLVALERAFDEGINTTDTQSILDMLNRIRGIK